MPRRDSGLCTSCVFARVIASARGSRFILCRRSETDARFPRYPALPVLECIGYEKAPADNTPLVDESICSSVRRAGGKAN